MSGVRYLSVCSGIEAATVAWHSLGWSPVGFAEIEPFPSAVLAHHYGSNMPGGPPAANGVPNFGDFTQIPLGALGPVDVLVGGTPCQAFSLAGRRLSLADARGNLTLAYAVLAHDLADNHGLRNAVWENVPGVLSTDDNAFGCFLGALVGADDALRSPLERGRWPSAGMVAGPWGRAAWRVLDAQHFGLAQRRRRVFVVASPGDGGDPAAVLFEPAGLCRHPPARGEAGQGAASAAGGRAAVGGRICADIAPTLTAAFSEKCGLENQHIDGGAGLFVAEVAGHFIAHTLRGEGFDASEDGTGRGIPLVPEPVAFMAKDFGGDAAVGLSPTLRAGVMPATAFPARMSGTQVAAAVDIAPALGALNPTAVATQWAVRRLTPRECERLQGFPDDYTAIPWRGKPAENCPDGPRYRALGNSMAVPVMAWIGRRIDEQLRRAA